MNVKSCFETLFPFVHLGHGIFIGFHLLFDKKTVFGVGFRALQARRIRGKRLHLHRGMCVSLITLTDKLNFWMIFFPDGSDPAQSTTPNLTDPFMAFEAVPNLLYTESYPTPSPLQSTAHVPFPRKTSFIWLRLYVERKCTGGAKATHKQTTHGRRQGAHIIGWHGEGASDVTAVEIQNVSYINSKLFVPYSVGLVLKGLKRRWGRWRGW